MSSLKERIAAKVATLGVAPIIFLGEALCVRLKSVAEYKAQKFTAADSDDLVAKDLAENILDPDTMKPAFDVEFLTTVLKQAQLFDLIKLYFKIQNGGTVADAEKNSAAAPRG